MIPRRLRMWAWSTLTDLLDQPGTYDTQPCANPHCHTAIYLDDPRAVQLGDSTWFCDLDCHDVYAAEWTTTRGRDA
jgi:hypothetical protein